MVECLCYLLVGGPLELVVLLGEADLLHHVPAQESSAAEGGKQQQRKKSGTGARRESGAEGSGRRRRRVNVKIKGGNRQSSPLALGLVEDEVGGAVGAPADLLHHLVLLHRRRDPRSSLCLWLSLSAWMRRRRRRKKKKEQRGVVCCGRCEN